MFADLEDGPVFGSTGFGHVANRGPCDAPTDSGSRPLRQDRRDMTRRELPMRVFDAVGILSVSLLAGQRFKRPLVVVVCQKDAVIITGFGEEFRLRSACRSKVPSPVRRMSFAVLAHRSLLTPAASSSRSCFMLYDELRGAWIVRVLL